MTPDAEARRRGGAVPVERVVGLGIDDAFVGQVTRGGRDCRLEQGRAERRIEKDHIPALIRLAGEPSHSVSVFDGGGSIEPRPLPVEMVDRFAVVVDERGVAGTSRQRLEAERSGPCEKVEHAGARHCRAEPVEQGDARPVRRRPDGGPGHLQLSPLPLTADNADLYAPGRSYSRHGLIVLKSKRKLDPVDPDESAWARLRGSLAKTRQRIAEGVGDLILGERVIDADLLDELETALLVADVGVDATERITDALRGRVSRRELGDAGQLRGALAQELVELLAPVARPFEVGPERPYVVLVVGVNGAGKTTLIGKLAKRLVAQGHGVLLAAGDTFRAAAVEQLSDWGRRNGTAVISQGKGADSASVIYDAIEAAQARGVDVVLADTAGRLQAKVGLMDELRKIKRVMGRLEGGAPHEVLLVLDAGVGQNALSQVREFDNAVGVSSLAVTKLDGTAKAGIVVAIAAATGLPVRFIGVGEGVDDLQDFEPEAFASALLA